MGIANGSRFRYAVAAVCVLAALLTGCSRDPNVRKQKYLESGQRYFDKGQYREAEIQFENAIQVDSRFADAHYKLALAAMKLQQWPTAYQELLTTVQIQPDQYAAHLDMANLLILGRQFNDAKEHLDLLAQKQPTTPTSTSHGPTTPPPPIALPPRWRICRRRCNWIPADPSL